MRIEGKTFTPLFKENADIDGGVFYDASSIDGPTALEQMQEAYGSDLEGIERFGTFNMDIWELREHANMEHPEEEYNDEW